MRIISGKYKGRKIFPPKNLPVRPTTDMSKESLFNILNNHFDFQELQVLDLFAGTGNISYEFGSRGAGPITCVDEDFGCVRFIKKTAEEFEFDIHAIKANVFTFLEKASGSFDVIFADPPYHMEEPQLRRLVDTIFERELLSDDGMLIIEHSRHTNIDNAQHFSFRKNYGGSVFSFFEFEQQDQQDEEEE